MKQQVTIHNRQRVRAVDTRQLRRIVKAILSELISGKPAELGINLVAAPEMTRVNEQFLQHAGSTDVITFDYGESNETVQANLAGEIFICVDEAIAQARRFRVTWQSELARYLIHGILHLLGFRDSRAADRKKMKREENRLLRLISRQFPLSRLERRSVIRT